MYDPNGATFIAPAALAALLADERLVGRVLHPNKSGQLAIYEADLETRVGVINLGDEAIVMDEEPEA